MVYQNRKYLVRDKGPDGVIRWYVRVPGRKKVRLLSPPDTPEFDKEYWVARGEDAKPQTRVAIHSLEWLIKQYFASATFTQSSTATQTQRKSILGRIAKENGDRPYKTLTSQAVREGRDKRAATPGAANNMLKAVKALYKWAKDAGHVDHNPAAGVERLKMEVSTWVPWSPEQQKQYEEFHPIGTVARTAFALARYGGYRRSDAVRIGRQHRRGDELTIAQKKTGHTFTVVMGFELQEALDAAQSDHLHYLVNAYGRPYSDKGFGARFKQWVKAAGLPDYLSYHGLRKSRGVDLAENGATQEEIAAALGQTSVKTTAIYTKGADQKRLARQAQEKANREQNVQGGQSDSPRRRKT